MTAHTTEFKVALYGVSSDDSGFHGPGIAHLRISGGGGDGWDVRADTTPDRPPVTTHHDELPASLAWLLGLLGLTPTEGD